MHSLLTSSQQLLKFHATEIQEKEFWDVAVHRQGGGNRFINNNERTK
jgi:hypothetical protein